MRLHPRLCVLTTPHCLTDTCGSKLSCSSSAYQRLAIVYSRMLWHICQTAAQGQPRHIWLCSPLLCTM